MNAKDAPSEMAGTTDECVYIGIGSNQGDSPALVRTAILDCATIAATALTGASSLYRSVPIDSSGADYVNAVVRLSTRLAPSELMAHLHAIEHGHGRDRPYRNAPRTLDLDLLLFGERVIATDDLTVPHPRMHLRAFVLRPLAELEPGLVVVGRGAVGALLGTVGDQRIEPL